MAESICIHFDQVTVGYEGNPVVSDIQLDVKGGQILTLVGPNGAGKTTVLKNVIKQLTPLSGVVYLEEKALENMSLEEFSKQMSVVLTTPIHSELMKVIDVVETGRYPYTGRFGILSTEDHEIVERVMKLVRVDEIKECDYNKISDGQKQRVLLARALAQEPKVLVLDEPTSFLDIKYKLQFLSILKRLAKEQGVTIIMSLHEVELATRVSDLVACFCKGRLDCVGAPEEVFKENYISQLYDINLEEVDESLRDLI